MLKGLKLINFQSHRHSELEFSSGVNVIVGLSDAGKSAIIKAIDFAANNRPIRNDYRSHWGGRMLIQISTTDEKVISREEGEERCYKIDTLKLKAFGTDVPQEVRTALNFEDVNIQRQQDSHFLLNNTAGDVAKYFNKVAKFDKIDLGQQNVDKWIREINSSISYKEGQLVQEAEKLKQFVDIEKEEAEIEVLENLEKQLKAKERNIDDLSKLIISLESLETKINEFNEILEDEDSINNIILLYENNRNLDNKIQNLEGLINQLINIENEIENSKLLIEEEGKIDLVLSLFEKFNKTDTEERKLANHIEDIEDIEEKITEAEEEYKQLHEEFEQEMGDTCVLCGTKLK